MPPNTKATPWKELKSPMCPFTTYDLGTMKEHLASCGLQKMALVQRTVVLTVQTDWRIEIDRKRHEETNAKASDREWAKK